MSHRYSSILSLLFFLAAAACGCGDSNKNAPPSTDMSLGEPDLPPLPALDLSNSSPDCHVALTGAATGSVGCTVQGVWTKGENLGGINLTGSESMPGIQVTINRPGTPQKGTWTQADSGSKAAIVVTSGLEAWSVSIGGSSADQGTYSLTLTDVTEILTTDDGNGYLVKGTLDATLPPSSGGASTDPVTLHATF
jgi:hypothetical protein